jgi:hypothetical protein
MSVVKQGGEGGVDKEGKGMEGTVHMSNVNHVTTPQYQQEVEGDSDPPSFSNANHHSPSTPFPWSRPSIR